MKKRIVINFFLLLSFTQLCVQFQNTSCVYAAKKRMVEVSVDAVEITETNMKKLGIEWLDSFSFEEGSIPSLLNVNSQLDGDKKYALGSSAAPYDTYKIGKVFRTSPFLATLHALINNNEARLLANPKLITQSGSEAEFLVGGEVPYAYQNGDNLVIAWKKYGVTLKILPEILNSSDIEAVMEIGVKELGDWVKLYNFELPSFTERYMANKVTIKNGQTIVIGGLKKTSRTESKKKVPVLGYIPLIGNLFFTYANVSDVRTSLVVFVTFKMID